MDNFQQYIDFVHYFKQTYGSGTLPPDFNQWKRLSSQQQQMPTPAPVTINEEEGNKKFRERWSKDQINVLVNLWKDSYAKLETAKAHEVWVLIKSEVDKHGNNKTIKQCRDKIKNLKNAYKKAKEENKKTGREAIFPPFYEEFDQVLGCRAVIKMPEAYEVGAVSDENEDDPFVDPSFSSPKNPLSILSTLSPACMYFFIIFLFFYFHPQFRATLLLRYSFVLYV